MGKMSDDTRQKVLEILCTDTAESMAGEFDSGDYYDIAMSGYVGYESYSDEELLSEFKERYVDDGPPVSNVENSQVSVALKLLKVHMVHEDDKAAVDRALQAHKDAAVVPERQQAYQSHVALYEQAKQEMGL